MEHSHSRSTRWLLNEWLSEAHERELYRELAKLDKEFAKWRAGAISSGELSYRIHRYHQGPARALFKRYNDGPAEQALAYAVVTGIVDEAEIPVELLEALSRPLDLYRSWKEQDTLREPDDL